MVVLSLTMDISIPSPHTGRDHINSVSISTFAYFNPLSPYGERRFSTCFPRKTALYFNSLSPYGERQHLGWRAAAIGIFQFPLPIRGETHGDRCYLRRPDISIPSPHTGRDLGVPAALCLPAISIPSPHTGRDAMPVPYRLILSDFNSLSPYGERLFCLPIAHLL